MKATVGSGSDELTAYKYFNRYHELQDIRVTLEYMPAKGITSVTIPESVRYIGDNAFANTGLTSVTVPSSVYSLNGSPFGFNISYDKDGKEIATTVEGFKVYAKEESAAGQ